MNRGEASFILANIDRRVCDDELNEVLDVAIKALEQEPCEDAISRQYLIDIATKDGAYDYVSAQEIANAPSVNSQPKTGYWIDDNENEIDARYGRHLYKCSECNEYADMFVGSTEDWWDIEKPNYCPNCGCRMVDPQESEKINCKSTKCENCINHNYCDYEPQERSDNE